MTPSQNKFHSVSFYVISVSLIAFSALIKGNANEPVVYNPESSEFTFEELTADLDVIDAPPENSRFSTRLEDFIELRKNGVKYARPRRPDSSLKSNRFKYTAAGGLKSAWKKCNLFLNESGSFGPYGKIVSEYIDSNLSSVLLSNKILGLTDDPKACPNWTSFDDQMKKKFWVWTLASIAAIEGAGCNTHIPDIKDVTGQMTFGMFQLERNKTLRESNRRFEKHCLLSLTDLRKPIGSIRCAMDMLTTQLITRKSTPIEFDGRIYPGPGMEVWTYFNEFHHIDGGYIGQLMRQFEPCGA